MKDQRPGELHGAVDGSEAAGGADERRNEPEAAERPNDVERELADMLAGEPESEPAQERDARLRSRLSPKYEIRIQTTYDPIVKETERYRELAEEIDDRYDRYMERARKRDDE